MLSTCAASQSRSLIWRKRDSSKIFGDDRHDLTPEVADLLRFTLHLLYFNSVLIRRRREHNKWIGGSYRDGFTSKAKGPLILTLHQACKQALNTTEELIVWPLFLTYLRPLCWQCTHFIWMLISVTMAKGIGNGFPMAAVVTTPGEQQTRPNISVMRKTTN